MLLKVRDLSEFLSEFDDDLDVRVSTVRRRGGLYLSGYEDRESQEVTSIIFTDGVLIFRGGGEKI